MKSLVSRTLAGVAAVLVCCLLLAAVAASGATGHEPDKLIILSTTDVKGKTSPCG